MRCLIVTPYMEGSLSACLPHDGAELIVCADTAYRQALEAGITPDAVIGDFDHGDGQPAKSGKVIRVPSEKDDTDTMAAVRYAVGEGFDEIMLYSIK